MSGKISGYFTTIVVTPVIQASSYSSGNQVGGIQTLTMPDGGSQRLCTLLSVSVVDLAVQSAALTIFFFNQLPTIASTDKTAFNLTDANMLNCVGAITIAAADYQVSSSNGIATERLTSSGLCMQPASTSSALYAVAMTTGTPTYAGVSDLQFRYVFGLD